MNKTRLDVICEKAIKAAIQEKEFLHEGSLRVLLVEGIDEDDQSELAKQVDATHKTIDNLSKILPETWVNTKDYLRQLKDRLPNSVEIFRLDLDGSKKEIAAKVSESTLITKYVNSIMESLTKLSKITGRMWKIALEDAEKMSDEQAVASNISKLKNYLNMKNAKFNFSDIERVVKKSYTMAQGGLLNQLKHIFMKGLPVWDWHTFKSDILNSSFADLGDLTTKIIENSKKIEQKIEKSDEQIGAIVKSATPEISTAIKTSEPVKPKSSTPAIPVTPVKTRPEDKKAAAAASRAKTRVKSPPTKQPTTAQPVPRKKVKILGDIVKYRDPENRDKGFVYAEPKGVDLMNAISMMSKNPNAKSRSAFKDAMNAVVGEEIFEQKKTGDDIIVEKWQRLAGIKR